MADRVRNDILGARVSASEEETLLHEARLGEPASQFFNPIVVRVVLPGPIVIPASSPPTFSFPFAGPRNRVSTDGAAVDNIFFVHLDGDDSAFPGNATITGDVSWDDDDGWILFLTTLGGSDEDPLVLPDDIPITAFIYCFVNILGAASD
jgi:hypothetical protein